jgi:alpha-ketoglutarate-dependent taurine dioxygenase
MSDGTMDIVALKPRIGSQVVIDKAELMSGRHAAELRELLEQRGVLILRGIDLSDEEEMAVAAAMGTIRQDFGRPIMRVTLDRKANADHVDYFHATFHWHMDGTYEDVPPLASILTPRVLPPAGTGQTEFANSYAAYEDLSEFEKKRLEGLKIVHSSAFSLPPDEAPSEAQLARVARLGTKIHPLVWHHRSGRKSLALGASAERIVGLDKAESDAMLRSLMGWMTRPEYVYRHEWRMGDVLMWDNTGTLHRALPYDKDCGRRLHRVTLVGEESISEAA